VHVVAFEVAKNVNIDDELKKCTPDLGGIFR
jgi:hypothetical protein